MSVRREVVSLSQLLRRNENSYVRVRRVSAAVLRALLCTFIHTGIHVEDLDMYHLCLYKLQDDCLLDTKASKNDRRLLQRDQQTLDIHHSLLNVSEMPIVHQPLSQRAAKPVVNFLHSPKKVKADWVMSHGYKS
ncbi:unnamed protein product [Peronospora destructor]|uniref:Uncharacterized protein n=1 Tax=Peronospora destructor TaxID=86335 RepID=A0AAV0UHJ2_9STRA|nr:unnamed protein product [Peronospora destructor]